MATAFTTVSLVKQLLSVQPSTMTDVGLLQSLVEGVSAEFGTILSREILSTDYDVILDGTGTPTIMLKYGPVTAVTSVAVGPPSGRTTLTVNTDYVATRNAIKSLCGIWTPGIANVRVLYTGGYATVPRDLQLAATKAVAYRYKQTDRIGQVSKNMGGETVSFETAAYPKDVQQVLEQYQRRIPAQ